MTTDENRTDVTIAMLDQAIKELRDGQAELERRVAGIDERVDAIEQRDHGGSTNGNTDGAPQ
jgi:hypothetical protein